MTDLFEDINFLENFFARMLVFQLTQFDHFYRNKLSCQFLNGQVNLPESSVADFLYEMVKI